MQALDEWRDRGSLTWMIAFPNHLVWHERTHPLRLRPEVCAAEFDFPSCAGYRDVRWRASAARGGSAIVGSARVKIVAGCTAFRVLQTGNLEHAAASR